MSTNGPRNRPTGPPSDGLASWIPSLRSLGTYRREDLAPDVSAGLTIAVLLVPQGMAYAVLAGMPPITGLYTAIGALVLYALLGTSPYVSPGPTALTALLVASALQPLAGGDIGRYVALAAMLAVLVGMVRLVLGLLRAGTFMNLVSQPVLTGFTAAAGIIIILTQAGDLLGIEAARSDRVVPAVQAILGEIGHTHPLTLGLGVACLAAFLVTDRMPDRFPGVLIVVVVVTAAVWVLDLDQRGVSVIGDVPGGLKMPVLPWVGGGALADLATTAVVIGLIGYVEGVSISQSIAMKTRRRIDLNQEFIALGAASIGSGVLGGFPNGGSFSRTALNHRVGARTRFAGVSAAVVLTVAVAFLTPLFRLIPLVALSAIVIYAALSLFEFQAATEAIRLRRRDGVALVVAFLATLFLGVEAGFLVGAGLNLLLYLYRVTRPRIRVLGRVHGTDTFRNVDRWKVETAEQVAILRLDAPLIFLSVESFTDRVNRILAEQPDVDGFVLDAAAITEIDATGIHALHSLLEQADEGGWDLRFATLRGPVRDTIKRAGLWETIAERAYPDVGAAVRSLEAAPSAIGQAGPEEEAPKRIL